MPVDARPFTDPEIMADSNKTGTAATRKRLKGENSCDDPSHEVPKRKKPKKENRKKRPGFDEEIYSETTYYIENGLRYVRPYYFTFTTHAKGRWVGSKVIDVFSQEFQSETSEFYEKALEAGKITVNEKVATMDTVIGNNELVCHKVHRHEPPVTAQPFTIIHSDDHLVVLDKPPSIPVHPCGRYRHNSVVFLLAVHRLDRLTSGLLMFAKTISKAQQLEMEIRERKVTKVYVCRVKGKFPSEPIECNEPILVVSHKLGVCHVDPTGKECSTRFTRLSFNGKSSVVRCVPKTGRMHQIRVHLQWLGFPIMNDPLYNHPAWKVGGEGEPVNVDHVISEIVKSNYTTRSHDQTHARNIDSIEGELKHHSSSLKLSDFGPLEIENLVTTSEHLSEAVDTTSRTTDHEGDDTLDLGQEKTISEILKPNDDDVNVLRTSPEVNKVVAASVVGVQVNKIEVLEGESEVREEESLDGTSENVERSQEKLVDKLDLTEHSSLVGASKEGLSYDPDCTECRTIHADPTPSELMMYLHALSYKGDSWEYSTAMPEWALPDWNKEL